MAEDNKLVLFTLEGRKYALPLDAVERVERAAEITPLPKAPEIVLGILNIHGSVIPIVNIRKRFSLPEREISVGDQIVIVRTQRRKLGFFADSVQGYFETPPDEITKEDEIWNGVEYVRGVIKLRDELIIINNLEKFFLQDEETKIDEALRENV